MRLLAPLLVFCLFITQGTFAQTHQLSGTVVDPAGRPIPGVAIELRPQKGEARRTVSDAQGAWKFENLPAGRFEVQASLAGFRTSVIRIELTQPVQTLRIPLQVGAITEKVEVTGATPPVGAPVAPPPLAQTELSSRSSMSTRSAGAVGGGHAGGAYIELRQDGLIPITRDTASYAEIKENTYRAVAEHPLSTFSIDVDTASYANVRRFLNQGRLPPVDAVRIEELLNYFRFDYPAPRGDAPVSVTTELGAAPWNPKHKLALIGLRTAPIRQESTPPRNLTFLLDVSGSMTPVNRLPLIKTAMRMLVDTLRAEDKVAIVVYAGHSGLALPPTSGDRKDVIQRALSELQAGGSTNGAAGIQLAYNLASENFIKDGINRVILATDGDFNVGITSENELTRLIEAKRERGIFLSVLGVGDNNLKDSTMEKLADKGNGNYAYLDSLQEARRVLIAEAGATLVTVAKDVKIQIEFNPNHVAAYRLIGYENRLLRKEDFNNDRKDAGEMGAGHTVTALYELVPPGQPVPSNDVDPLRYQVPVEEGRPTVTVRAAEMMNVKVRYKAPQGDTSRLLEFPVRADAPRMTSNLGFASSVAGFGMLLRRSDYRGSATWGQMLSLARTHKGNDPDGYRGEFVRLVDLAAALSAKDTSLESVSRR